MWEGRRSVKTIRNTLVRPGGVRYEDDNEDNKNLKVTQREMIPEARQYKKMNGKGCQSRHLLGPHRIVLSVLLEILV